MQTCTDLRLRRSPGIPYPSSYALAVFRRYPHDVNGYYAELGLMRGGRVWVAATQDDIRRAYRRRLYDLHPDRGAFDADAWERADNARLCLVDPVSRFRYDQMREPMRWPDSRTVKELRDTLDELTEECRQELLAQQDDLEVETVQFAFYLGDGARTPPLATIRRWQAMVAYCYHSLGVRQPVRLGFVRGPARVLREAWGRIILVPDDVQPTLDFAAYCVCSEEYSEWYLPYCNLAAGGWGHPRTVA